MSSDYPMPPFPSQKQPMPGSTEKNGAAAGPRGRDLQGLRQAGEHEGHCHRRRPLADPEQQSSTPSIEMAFAKLKAHLRKVAELATSMTAVTANANMAMIRS
jgi:hypothetical protein